MDDWLDDLLYELPYELPTPDLTSRVLAQLTSARQSSSWLHFGMRLAMGAIGVFGLWLVLSQLKMLFLMISSISFGSVEGWLGVFVNSPDDAFLNLLGLVLSWVSRLADSLGFRLVFALGLLAVATFYGVVFLLPLEVSKEGAVA